MKRDQGRNHSGNCGSSSQFIVMRLKNIYFCQILSKTEQYVKKNSKKVKKIVQVKTTSFNS